MANTVALELRADGPSKDRHSEPLDIIDAKDITTMVNGDDNGRAKAIRKQGVSCDACKFRKVRCDRRVMLESQTSTMAEEVDQIACSVCLQHGIRCTFTQAAPRRRRGKRIVAIQTSQQNDEDEEGLARRAVAVAAERERQAYQRRLLRPTSIKDSEGRAAVDLQGVSFFGFDVVLDPVQADAAFLARIREAQRACRSSARPSDQMDLFGVRGLNRALLDACVRQYFTYAAACRPIINFVLFGLRYSLFFSLYDTSKGTVPTGYDQSGASLTITPPSLLLILAIACVGAALLEEPIAEPGSSAKYRMQDRLAAKFQELVCAKDFCTLLKEEGTDLIEACYAVSDPSLKVLGNSISAQENGWADILQTPLTGPMPFDPLRMSPSTAEAVVRMMLFAGLNQRPRVRHDCPADDPRAFHSYGVAMTEAEAVRRLRIFYSTFFQDGFRCLGARKCAVIGNDDYDVDIPQLVPQDDGSYRAILVFAEAGGAHQDGIRDTSSDSMESDVQDLPAGTVSIGLSRFDALKLEVTMRLAYIMRKVAARFASPRAQGRGILLADVERATTRLNEWWTNMPAEITLEAQLPPLLHTLAARQADDDDGIALRNAIKSVFIEMQFHGNVLAVWSAVEENRFCDEEGQQRRGRGDHSPIDPFSVRQQKAEHALDYLAVRSFQRMAKLAKDAGAVGLLRANRSVMLNVCMGYAKWGCNLGRRMANAGTDLGLECPSDLPQIEFAFSLVEDIVSGICTVDTTESVSTMTGQMGDLLAECRSELGERIFQRLSQATRMPTLAIPDTAASVTTIHHDPSRTSRGVPWADRSQQPFLQPAGVIPSQPSSQPDVSTTGIESAAASELALLHRPPYTSQQSYSNGNTPSSSSTPCTDDPAMQALAAPTGMPQDPAQKNGRDHSYPLEGDSRSMMPASSLATPSEPASLAHYDLPGYYGSVMPSMGAGMETAWQYGHSGVAHQTMTHATTHQMRTSQPMLPHAAPYSAPGASQMPFAMGMASFIPATPLDMHAGVAHYATMAVPPAHSQGPPLDRMSMGMHSLASPHTMMGFPQPPSMTAFPAPPHEAMPSDVHWNISLAESGNIPFRTV